MKTKLFLNFSFAAIFAISIQSALAQSPQQSATIPIDQLGAIAGKQYQGDGLSIVATTNGARLRCVFQRLEGEATADGLWLSSTADGSSGERFRVKALEVRRATSGPAADVWGATDPFSWTQLALALVGKVKVADKTVQFVRSGLTEEYSVSMDGVRQDFVIEQRPVGKGKLRLELDVNGARAEATAQEVRLVLNSSGRKITYGQLRVTDAIGRELPSQMEVAEVHALTILVDDVDAVYPVRIDPTFSDEDWIGIGGGLLGANSQVQAAVVHDGNLYVGGHFTVIGTVMANRIARWDGNTWSTLGSGLNGPVFALVAAGTDLYVGGSFTAAGGVIVNRIAKWDGTAWSALGDGMSGSVYALAWSGMELFAGGSFTTAGGQAAGRIAKWSGSAWSTLGSGMNNQVNALAFYGENLCAGGSFTLAGGTSANRIALWDGVTWTALGTGLASNVNALTVSGSDLYVGGMFTNAGSVNANGVARWDGSTWNRLALGVQLVVPPLGFNVDVKALAVKGNVLYVGGLFNRAGGITGRENIAKWAIGATNNSGWSTVGLGVDDPVFALTVFGDDVFAGGSFWQAGTETAYRVARWDGTNWFSLGSGFNSYITALAVSETDLYVGGGFTTTPSGKARKIAKWNGDTWSPLGSGMSWGFNGSSGDVYALVVSETDLYVGGDFDIAGTNEVWGIAKWAIGGTNNASWSSLGTGVAYGVNALAVHDDYLYVGGGFTIVGNISGKRNYVVKWAIGGTNNSSWSSLGQGVGSDVYALAVKDNDLYVGGIFTSAGGVSGRNRIAKWAIGSTNDNGWSALGSGLDGRVNALAVSGNDLYVGGAFTNAGGIVSSNIAKWNGSAWSSLGSGVNNQVLELASSGSDLYVGGSFTTAGGNAANYIAKWDANSWSALGSGMNGSIGALVVAGTNLYAGGGFSTAGGKLSVAVAMGRIGLSPGRFANPTYSPVEGFSCTFLDASVGQPYRIQRSPTLNPASWMDFTNFTYSGPIEITSHIIGMMDHAFLRAVSP